MNHDRRVNRMYDDNTNTNYHNGLQDFGSYFDGPDADSEELNPERIRQEQIRAALERNAETTFDQANLNNQAQGRAIHNDAGEFATLKSTCTPFKSKLEFALISFFDGCATGISEEKQKLILFMMETILEMKEADPTLKFPPHDRILNWINRKNCDIPKLKTTVHFLKNKKNEVKELHAILPSAHLEFLMADPIKAPQLVSFPDFSNDKLTCFQQGKKWQTHYMFQNPMHDVNGMTIWVGDIVVVDNSRFLVNKFYQKSKVIYFDGYAVRNISDPTSIDFYDTNFMVSRSTQEQLTTGITSIVSKNEYHFDNFGLLLFDEDTWGVPVNLSFIPSEGSDPDRQLRLFKNEDYASKNLKRKRADGTYIRAYISPITIFTDDTSGNLTKQYCLFDSFVMTPAAMSFDARGSKNNIFFICTSSKDLNAVEMLPPLVDDLCRLETGIEMYSALHNDYVLVVAPLLFIQADNYRHAELSMHKGSGSNHCCRKCLFRVVKNPNKKLRKNATAKSRQEFANRVLQAIPQINHKAEKRTKSRLMELADENTDPSTIQYMNESESSIKNRSEVVLKLKAYEAPLDTPVEQLHTLVLGLMKLLVTFLWAKVMNTKEKKENLQVALETYRSSKSYSRNFRSLMRHNGSFIGRNYKQLVQIYPAVLRSNFDVEGDELLRLTTKCFDIMGLLSSLVYMRGIHHSVEKYKQIVQMLIDQLSEAALKLDNYCILEANIDPPLLSTAPKMHFLHHIVEDIDRFGPPVLFETENGEMFNKFIREAVQLTNRHFSARDITFMFAAQYAIRHLINAGSFLVTKKRMAIMMYLLGLK